MPFSLFVSVMSLSRSVADKVIFLPAARDAKKGETRREQNRGRHQEYRLLIKRDICSQRVYYVLPEDLYGAQDGVDIAMLKIRDGCSSTRVSIRNRRYYGAAVTKIRCYCAGVMMIFPACEKQSLPNDCRCTALFRRQTYTPPLQVETHDAASPPPGPPALFFSPPLKCPIMLTPH